MTKPILDLSDDQLYQIITHGMSMNLEEIDKVMPGISDLRDLMCELALRLREVRRLAKLGAESINGQQWVRADALLRLLDS
jgi:hypothetical protein